MPASIGTNSNTRFCTISFPTGKTTSTPACCETNAETAPIISGRVNNVTTLLTAVRVTESATSPLASMENTFEELPPGQQATSTRPIKYTAGKSSTHAMAKAMRGRRTSCPVIPIITPLGFRATLAKACLFKSVPSRNINTISMGITIQTVFIQITI